jgi:hypothetical protein
MSASHSGPPAKNRRVRSDGWTAERQLRFLNALARTGNVRDAAAHARMSRESAYRLRDRREGALFALLWDRILAPAPPSEVHIEELSNGRIMRMLERFFGAKAGILPASARKEASRDDPRRTRPL